MSKKDADKNNKTIDGIKNIAGDSIGAIASAGIAGSIPGPIGIALGSLFGSVLAEVLSRALSQKEQKRVSVVSDIARTKIEKNLEEGQTIRDDDFFTTDRDRSSAEELYEGILISAQREYEERKLELLGKMYANIAFDKSITRQIANALIKISTELTYQELKIIKVIGCLQLASEHGLDPRINEPYNTIKGLSNVTIASDIHSLYVRSIVHSSDVIFDAATINPSKITLVGYGALLFKLMELDKSEIDDTELEIIRFMTEK